MKNYGIHQDRNAIQSVTRLPQHALKSTTFQHGFGRDNFDLVL